MPPDKQVPAYNDCFTFCLLSAPPSPRIQECKQAGKAISMPPIAVLAGLLVIVGFSMSHSVVQVADTDWVEPVLLWIAICMQTGSGKSGLCKFLKSLVLRARSECHLGPDDPSWCLDDQSFEKMGAIMSENHGKLRRTTNVSITNQRFYIQRSIQLTWSCKCFCNFMGQTSGYAGQVSNVYKITVQMLTFFSVWWSQFLISKDRHDAGRFYPLSCYCWTTCKCRKGTLPTFSLAGPPTVLWSVWPTIACWWGIYLEHR